MSIRKSDRIISVEHVSKYFGEKAVLNDVNLQVRKGEFVTILGPSGCGKTTLLRLIAGFQTASEGVITMSGKEITQTPPHKRPVNTVFQKYALFSHLNVFENVAFGLKIRKLPKDEIKRRVTEMLELVNLAGYEKRYIDQLSGGQQQRVAIARALATDPEIIYFDEPTSALDPELTGEVLSVMRKLAEEGMTMLVVTHEMGFARNVSSKTVFMENGVVVEQAPSHEFFAHPREERTREFLRKIEHTA